jgi:hypothetical protein
MRLFYSVYIKEMSGAFLLIWRQLSGAILHMEACFGGRYQYGGRFRDAVLIWRQVSEAGFNMEAVLFVTGENFYHVKAKPVNLCRCSSAKGKLT